MNKGNLKKGFTLIELLIVIAIIAVLAAVVFVALDPLNRFRNARDAARWSDVTNILGAIKLYQIDNNGVYEYGVSNYDEPAVAVETNTNYMISSATTTSGCNTNCTAVASSSACVNLQGLVDAGYLPNLPVSPAGAKTWSSTDTGYYMTVATSTIAITACDPENASSISVAR